MKRRMLSQQSNLLVTSKQVTTLMCHHFQPQTHTKASSKTLFLINSFCSSFKTAAIETVGAEQGSLVALVLYVMSAKLCFTWDHYAELMTGWRERMGFVNTFALNPLMDKTHKKQVNKVQTTAYKNTYGTDNRLKDIYKVR